MSASDTTLATLAPLERRPLRQGLLDALRQMIIEGALPPGEKINERELCERFAVSRTPMREAINLLAAEGLVSVTPHRGASVTPVTLEEIEEAFPVMGALEALTGELAAARATEAEIATVRALHEAMVRHHRAGERVEYFRVNEAIHDALLDAARNPTLSQTARGLAARLRRARFRANLTESRWAAAVAEHAAFTEALEARDAALLSRLLRGHLENKLAAIRTALGASGGEVEGADR
ncbi:MAG: GntR family transcriptional regulator [Pseudomonadota bacterium]